MKALRHADRALTKALERNLDVAGFVEPLEHLQRFYFLNASRADRMLLTARSVPNERGVGSRRQNEAAFEMDELMEFAKTVLPVVLSVARESKLQPRREFWVR